MKLLISLKELKEKCNNLEGFCKDHNWDIDRVRNVCSDSMTVTLEEEEVIEYGIFDYHGRLARKLAEIEEKYGG